MLPEDVEMIFQIASSYHESETIVELRLGLLQGLEFLFSPEYKSNLIIGWVYLRRYPGRMKTQKRSYPGSEC
jgi:hypothetical protein